MKLTLSLIGLTAFLLGQTITANAEELYQAVYKGKYGSLKVTMTRTLQSDDGKNYQLNSNAKAFAGSIEETSLFYADDSTITPDSYRYKRKIFGTKKDELLKFDWPNQLAHYSKNNKESKKRPLAAGSLDPTLYQLQMQRDITRTPSVANLEYTFARRSQTKNYLFTRMSEEPLKVGNESYQAIVFARIDDEKETRFWVVPELDYTIGKIRHSEDGDSYEVQLVSYKSSSSFKDFLTPKKP